MAESPKFAHLEGNRGRVTRGWRQILDRKWKYSPLVHAPCIHPAIIIGTVRSLVVDVVMGQIPRSTERISSFVLFFSRATATVALSHLPYAICSFCTLCCMCTWQINADDDDQKCNNNLWSMNDWPMYSSKVGTVQLPWSWQDVQLSQRDRAAGCVIFFAKSRRLHGRQYFTDHIGLPSTTVI